MKLTRILVPIAAATCLSMGLVACSGDDGDALTIGESGDDNGEGDNESDEENSEKHEDGPGRLLTTKELNAALPVLGDLPSGWKRDKDNEDEDDDEDDGEKVTPARCEELLDNVDAEDKDPEAEATRAFTADDFGPFVSVEIETYDELVPGDALDKSAQALSQCRQFKTVDSDGTESTFKAKAVDFPSLGEETLAFQMDFTTDLFPGSGNFVAIRVGHNLIWVTNLALGDEAPSIKELEELANKTLERLEN